ncbi:MAG TPA: hypothetical protein RMH99_05705 [Sandaracinaceae bacterium LLY-WYZ-13_1]|nr:hypothetical protein [Sandaracinaceae bacterium LLY-WYZ-13_1]
MELRLGSALLAAAWLAGCGDTRAATGGGPGAPDATDGGAFGGDDDAREDGACRHLGCSDDADCRATFARDDYVCAPS